MPQFYKSSDNYKKYPFQVFVHESTVCGSLHGQDFYEIFIVYSENCVHYINGESKLLPFGAAVLAGPDDVHRVGSTDDKIFKYINLSFPKEVLFDLESFLHVEGEIKALFSDKDKKMVILNERQTEKWIARIKRLLGIVATDIKEAEMAMRLLLVQIFTKIYLRHEEELAAIPEWLTDICHFLGKDKNFVLSLEEIADHAGKSKEHLCRSMKRYLDISPMEYVNNLRVRYAASMLENSDMSITEIGLEVGFFSTSYFNKLFRKEYGISPSKYRQINQH